jgi:hypothetical protein
LVDRKEKSIKSIKRLKKERDNFPRRVVLKNTRFGWYRRDAREDGGAN